MIYFVEDDRNIRELVVYTLETTGVHACGMENAKVFWENMEKEQPELVLLDIMLPGEDGISILKKLRSDKETKHIPVIMVTAKGEEYDKVLALNIGADDYVVKPFGMMELTARVQAVLRRTRKEQTIDKIHAGILEMDVQKHEVLVNGEKVVLTLKEFEMLKRLLKNRGIVLTRDRLLEEIWGYDFDGETRTVDVHVRTLRQKLKEAGSMIETVRGVGYRIGGKHEK